MELLFSPPGSLGRYHYAIILARYAGGWLFCRHKDRTTWETPGGHVEEGESPLQAAKRELYEETGALEAAIRPLFDLSGEGRTAMVFLAEVCRLGELPPFEIAECRLFEQLPSDWTYPQIQPRLFARLAEEEGSLEADSG